MSTTIGLDIGFETVKMVGLQPAGRKWRLQGMAIANCPKDPWKVDELTNLEEIAKIIKEAMAHAKPHSISGKKVMAALPESVIFSGTFAAPKMPPSELKQALPLLIADRLSIAAEDYYFDYEEINSKCNPVGYESPSQTETKDKAVPAEKEGQEVTSEEPTEGGITVFAIAAKKTLVQSVINLCKLAGLELAGLDIKPGAIARAVINTNDTKSRLIIDMGVGGTGASVTEGKSLRVTSIIPWGLNAIGENVSGEVADLKSKAGPVFDELIHITRFFENRVCPGVKIEEIIISGSGANITNLPEIFTQETGLPAKLSDPFALVETGGFPVPKELCHTFSDAIGLAMRKV